MQQLAIPGDLGRSNQLKMIQVDGIAGASEHTRGSEKDAALAMVSDVAQEIDPIVAKRVLRKIDLYFMPAMLIGEFASSLAK